MIYANMQISKDQGLVVFSLVLAFALEVSRSKASTMYQVDPYADNLIRERLMNQDLIP